MRDFTGGGINVCSLILWDDLQKERTWYTKRG